MSSCIQVLLIRAKTEDLPLWSTSPTKQQPWPVGNSSLVLICHLSDLTVLVCLPALFMNPLCSVHLCFLFFYLHLCKLWSCAPWLYCRNLSAVGPVNPSGLGPAGEGCGRGSYAEGQSPLCKSVDDRGNDDA